MKFIPTQTLLNI